MGHISYKTHISLVISRSKTLPLTLEIKHLEYEKTEFNTNIGTLYGTGNPILIILKT